MDCSLSTRGVQSIPRAEQLPRSITDPGRPSQGKQKRASPQVSKTPATPWSNTEIEHLRCVHQAQTQVKPGNTKICSRRLALRACAQSEFLRSCGLVRLHVHAFVCPQKTSGTAWPRTLDREGRPMTAAASDNTHTRARAAI